MLSIFSIFYKGAPIKVGVKKGDFTGEKKGVISLYFIWVYDKDFDKGFSEKSVRSGLDVSDVSDGVVGRFNYLALLHTCNPYTQWKLTPLYRLQSLVAQGLQPL